MQFASMLRFRCLNQNQNQRVHVTLGRVFKSLCNLVTVPRKCVIHIHIHIHRGMSNIGLRLHSLTKQLEAAKMFAVRAQINSHSFPIQGGAASFRSLRVSTGNAACRRRQNSSPRSASVYFCASVSFTSPAPQARAASKQAAAATATGIRNSRCRSFASCSLLLTLLRSAGVARTERGFSYTTIVIKIIILSHRSDSRMHHSVCAFRHILAIACTASQTVALH